MTNATTTCDACGNHYTFTDYKKDRCPICCPDQVSEDAETDEYEQADWEYNNDD